MLSSNQTRKYVLYALGEIALVVIGILIALQINNWNERRNDEKKAYAYLTNLKSDFEDNLDDMHSLHNNLEDTKSSTKKVAAFIQGEESLSNYELVSNINRAGYIITYKIDIPTWDEIISSGDLNLIGDASLKAKISTFLEEYKMLTELEERKYVPVFVELMNYSPYIYDVSNGFNSTTTETHFTGEDPEIDVVKLRNDQQMLLLMRKIYRAANEQQDFLTSQLLELCEDIIHSLSAMISQGKSSSL